MLGGQEGAAMEWLRKGKKGLTVLGNIFLLVRSRWKVAWPGLQLTQAGRPTLITPLLITLSQHT